MSGRERKHCEVCRLPTAMMPCKHCVLRPALDPGSVSTLRRRSEAVRQVGEAFLLEGKYRLVAELGRGGMGMVFHAIDTSLERDVAVKFLLPELQSDPKLVERFRTEARAMASVEHPNVANIYSYGTYGEAPYFVMQYAHGSTVEDLYRGAVERGLHIPLIEVLQIVDQAALGLSAIHAAGVVHRDIKPGNMIYQPKEGRVVIMDFGIGRRITPGAMGDAESVGGTPAYMAPEVIGGQPVPSDEEYLADIYSLGITAFELITACHPGQCESWIEALSWHLSELAPVPSSFRDGLPIGVDELILRCLEKDRHSRFQSCDELRAELSPILSASRHWPQPRKNRIRQIPRQRTAPEEMSSVVVIAIDDVHLRDVIRREVKLRMPGVRVEAVRRASRALELAKSRTVEMLFASMRDPEMNGLEIAAAFAADRNLQAARLVLLGDDLSETERDLLLRLGVSSVLEPPVDTSEISGIFEASDRTSPFGRTLAFGSGRSTSRDART